MLKVELDQNVGDTVEAIEDELRTAGRKPQRLFGAEYEAALSDETWRTASGVRILSLIEYATFAGRFLKHPAVFVPMLALGLYFVRRRLSKTSEVTPTTGNSCTE